MAKFHGVLGFVLTREKKPGVWQEVTEEKEITGDYVQNYARWSTSNNANDDLSLSNRISVLLDDYIMDNLMYLRWVRIRGQEWKVTGVDTNYPRLTLTIGGVYHGDPNSD